MAIIYKSGALDFVFYDIEGDQIIITDDFFKHYHDDNYEPLGLLHEPY